MTGLFSPAEIDRLPRVISAPRFATYLRAVDGDPAAALALYRWNLQVCAAFLVPLHMVEVAIRNAVVEAVEAVHGPDWPWSQGFRRSLPNPASGYSQQRELIVVAAAQPTAGKVVADLRFFFWQKMFTARHDARLWDRHLPRVLPTLEDDSLTGRPARSVVHDELERIRGLRNRIAHHEPIFGRALADDYARLRRVIAWRCPIGAGWTDRAQGVEALLFAGPAGVPL